MNSVSSKKNLFAILLALLLCAFAAGPAAGGMTDGGGLEIFGMMNFADAKCDRKMQRRIIM